MYLLIINPESLVHRLPILFDSFEELQYYLYSCDMPSGIPFAVHELSDEVGLFAVTASSTKESRSQNLDSVLPLPSVLGSQL